MRCDLNLNGQRQLPRCPTPGTAQYNSHPACCLIVICSGTGSVAPWWSWDNTGWHGWWVCGLASCSYLWPSKNTHFNMQQFLDKGPTDSVWTIIVPPNRLSQMAQNLGCVHVDLWIFLCFLERTVHMPIYLRNADSSTCQQLQQQHVDRVAAKNNPEHDVMTGLWDDFPDHHMWISLTNANLSGRKWHVWRIPAKIKKHRSACTHPAFRAICIWDNLIQGNVWSPLKYCFPAHRSSLPPYHFNWGRITMSSWSVYQLLTN